MRGRPTIPQIETMGFSHQFVALLTHAVSRHMRHSTETTPSQISPCVLSRARACAWVRAEIGPYGARARCKPCWRPNGAACVCLPRGRGTGRSRALRSTIRSCTDTNHAAWLIKRLSNEYQSAADVCVKGRQI